MLNTVASKKRNVKSLFLLGKHKFYMGFHPDKVGTIIITAFFAVTLCTISFSQPTPPPGAVLIWSADYETGDHSQFNAAPDGSCNNGVIGVSATIAHNGNYAGIYSGDMPIPPPNPPKCREQWNVNFRSGYPANTGTWLSMTDFYWEGWFYVPTFYFPTGQTAWFSFATINSLSGNWCCPLVIDTRSDRLNFLWSVQTTTAFNQNLVNPPIQWPFNQWFKLSMIAHNFGTSNADVTLYQDNVAIIHATGNLSPGGNDADHWGLYMGSGIPSASVYNDDIYVYSIPAATATNEYPNSDVQVFVYSDPSTNYVNVTLSGINFSMEKSEFTIYDLCGRTVKKMECNSTSFIVNKNDLSDGMYIYELKNNKEIMAKGKLIIK